MGYIRHHAIIVTSWNKESIKKAHKRANTLFQGMVTDIIQSTVNGYDTFLIAPDGSKEGWEESNEGDAAREYFVKWINKQAYEDGSNSLRYVELFYGDDDRESKIINHN